MTRVLGFEVNMKCAKCGKLESAGCDCWEKCGCGWLIEKDKECGNPECIK